MWAYIQYKNISVRSDPRKSRVSSDPHVPSVPSDSPEPVYFRSTVPVIAQGIYW